MNMISKIKCTWAMKTIMLDFMIYMKQRTCGANKTDFNTRGVNAQMRLRRVAV
jgi:hypothetical protein